ncbi:alpha/beta fold hydrolase [Vitreimonas sp.]|uniref:alpha/beta fold hydrolase n=1 Tax=Vitreimonas sp. TaxID=3069702 RepID=UPI002EDA86D8
MAQARVNGISLEYETHGPEDGAPLLLISGLGTQLTRWPPGLYEKLVARGFRVIRFDNRDVGLSQKFAGAPTIESVVAARMQGQAPDIPYTLDDMAADAVGVLDHLGVDRAHIAGASMGGMIGQLVAADYPERVLSFTAIFTTTGNPTLPPSKPEAMAVLTTRAPDPNKDIEAYVEHVVRGARTIGSPAYPFEESLLRERALTDVRRAYEPLGVARQLAAVIANGDRRAKLANIKAPVVVLHGDADPLVPVEGGRDLAACVADAELRIVEGMGHDIPPSLYDTVIDAIARAAERSRGLA